MCCMVDTILNAVVTTLISSFKYSAGGILKGQQQKNIKLFILTIRVFLSTKSITYLLLLFNCAKAVHYKRKKYILSVFTVQLNKGCFANPLISEIMFVHEFSSEIQLYGYRYGGPVECRSGTPLGGTPFRATSIDEYKQRGPLRNTDANVLIPNSAG
jgi:hypothetical protein